MPGRIDTVAIKRSTDLLALIGSDTQLKRVASTRGGEWAGPCPFCGGDDRLRVQPVRNQWWCRQCSPDGRWSDGITYVMRRYNASFGEACQMLNGGSLSPVQLPPPQPVRLPPPDSEPSADWRVSAAQLVEVCSGQLWSADGERAREYLHQRGLTDETVKARGLGYNAVDREIAGLFVKAGITIPWWANGRLWHVNVRRRTGSEPKYESVQGGRPYLYGADDLRGRPVVVLTEGEFDCILLAQANDQSLVGVATLGSCSRRPTSCASLRLASAQRVIVAFDNDKPGQDGQARLLAAVACARPAESLELADGKVAKDVTDFWKAGGDLRGWLAYNVALHGQPPETRLGPPKSAIAEVPALAAAVLLPPKPQQQDADSKCDGEESSLTSAPIVGEDDYEEGEL